MTSFFKPKAGDTPTNKDEGDAKKPDDKGAKAGAPAVAAAAEGGSDNKICNMKRGDYMIHLKIEQAKELKMDSSACIDPIVEIRILGERKYTKALKGINALTVADWSEHIFFEKKNLEEEQLANARVEVKLLDKGFFKDALIGYYEFDLTYIYQMDKHALMHKWIIMSNPEGEDFGEVTGYLKISMTVCGAGDEQLPIEDDPNPELEEMISPPEIKPEFYQLYVRFFCAQDIVPMDTGFLDGDGKIDAYVRFDYRSTKLQTKVLTQKKGGEVHWNQEFLVPAQLPIMGGHLSFKVFDEDTIVDEIVGSFQLESKDIIGGMNGRYFWKNIYGSPLDCSGKHVDRMNDNPHSASLWKGRILMQVFAERTEKPVLLVREIETAEVNMAAVHLAPKQYQVAVQVMAGIALPENHKFQVQIRVAEHEWTTDDKKTAVFEENGKIISSYNRYQQNLHEGRADLMLPYIDVSDIGSVFVYLIRESTFKKVKERICFAKMRASELTNPNPDVIWHELEPDLAIGACKDAYKAGIVGLRMTIRDVTKDGPLDLKTQENWCIKLQRRPPTFLVRAYCFQARDLPAADENGSSDPFIRITDTGRAQDTRVIFDNVNPIFYQALDLGYEANRQEDMPPLIIDLFDMDVNTVTKNSVEFLSRAVLFLEDIMPFSEGDAVPEPKWYPLRFKKGGPQSGEVLMSFSVVEGDFMFKTPCSKLNLPVEAGIKMREYNVLMNILGLRHLQTAGILPVKKAFILFNIKSMVSPDVGNAIENIKTEPSAAGPDPTLNTLIEFDIELPTEKLFCPRMACTVYDSVMFGLSQPTIGTFVIPIGDLIWELAEERARETAALEHVVVRLKEITSSEAFVVALRASLRKKGGMREIMTPKDQDGQVLDKLDKGKRFRQNLADKMKAARQKEEGVSVEISQLDDPKDAGQQISEAVPLLGDDADDEIKMSGRVAEAEQNAVEGRQQNQNSLLALRVGGRQDTIGRAASRTASGQPTGLPRAGSSNFRAGSQNMLSPANDKFNPQLKEVLMAQEKEEREKAERDIEEARAKAEAEFLETANVVMPKYRFDETMQIDRECEKPPVQLFIGLGWDEDKDTNRRHYRRFATTELEKVKSVLPNESPFNQYDLKRGQSRGASKSVWQSLTGNVKEDESGQTSTEQIVGRFKAVIEVEVKTEKVTYKARKHELIDEIVNALGLLAKARGIFDFDLDVQKLDTIEGRKAIEQSIEPLGVHELGIVQKLADIESDEILRRMLLHENKCVVRVYMVSGYDLASRDIGGYSDPYLKLSIGSKVFSDRDNYILDEPNPTFNKHWDFETTFPGCPQLQVDAFDFDLLFGDDLIGTTNIDLEDRYFLPEWRALKDKPIEYRQIFHPSSAVSQGVLKMWVEINKAKVDPEHEAQLWDIRARPPQEIECRVCVFNTRDIKMMDDGGTSDVYFRAFFDSRKDAAETDTHYRCQTGTASFNYRLIYKLMSDKKDWKLTIQAFDRDFFSSNQIIGSLTVDLAQAFQDVILTGRPLCINKDYYEPYMKKPDEEHPWEYNRSGDPEDLDDTFWLPMNGKDKETNLIENHGFVRVQIDIMPKEYAEKNKAGAARDEPNVSPYLPPPVGRLSFSFNPCTMYKQLVGPKLRRKICIWFWTSICCALFISAVCYFVPIISGDIMARAI